ncbi:MAG: nucleoside hydrolase [Patescibacteria group bacterium]
MRARTILTDPGIDDLVALALLHKLAPTAKNHLVSTFGNAAEKITAINAKEFIAFAAPHWKFVSGASKPFSGSVERPWPDYFHGSDATWGVHPKVAIEGVKVVTSYPAGHVLSLGPLTEAAGLLERTISKMTVMGGAYNIRGNESLYAETNIAFDPDAAKYFFANVPKDSVSIVPLDITRKAQWSKKQISQIPEKDEVNIWLKTLLQTWFERYNHEREENFNLHDPLAVWLDFYPEQAIWLKSGVDVVLESNKRGETILNDSNPSCAIALDLIKPKNISKEIFSAIFD